MAVQNLDIKLNALTQGNKSEWMQQAKKRRDNKVWLKHSRRIAIRLHTYLKTAGIKQKELAEKLNVSPQQVNKILKGRENLTLETIGKIEQVLQMQLIQVPDFTANPEVKEYYTFKLEKKTKADFQVNKPKVIHVDFGTYTHFPTNKVS